MENEFMNKCMNSQLHSVCPLRKLNSFYFYLEKKNSVKMSFCETMWLIKPMPHLTTDWNSENSSYKNSPHSQIPKQTKKKKKQKNSNCGCQCQLLYFDPKYTERYSEAVFGLHTSPRHRNQREFGKGVFVSAEPWRQESGKYNTGWPLTPQRFFKKKHENKRKI